nr:MAG TPA: minor structural protein [Caudoviricetes sp.]
MSLKREMLINAGITDKEAIDEIMQAYGAGLEHARTQVKNELTAENETLKQQLETQSQTLEDLKKSSEANSDVKQALEKLQQEYEQYKVESDSKLQQINKTNAIALALKDVKAHDSDVLMKLIDIDKIELGEDGKPKLDEVVNGLRETKPFLFEQEQVQQQTQPQIVVGGNPNGTGQQETDPFQAIINSYGK